MKIKPLGDRVLIKPIEQEEKTPSGIYIPETAKEKSQQGEVIAIGDDEKIKVKPGDIVIYEKYAGNEIEIDNEKYLIVQNKEILAIVEKEKK